ncbi:protein JAZ7-like [Lycium ferocissimum]|uniref:protein JAZ7-like n=1 Tax=Lycium ferocissimum TaxID=112874 RepID=UPI0028163535|nr:protein JAZ7-like [Lycium ferocissimum]
MDSRMEIDFLDLNSRPQLSEMAKQHTKASGMKWPFSCMAELATQPENTFFQNYNSSPIVSSNSKFSSQYYGGAFPLATKYSTSDSRKAYDRLRQNETTLTIFYMGEVHIFQDISPEKAELIIDIANKSTNLHMSEILEKVKTEENKSEPSNASIKHAKGALALARRATLARFLEKRKHRLIKARPYQYGEKIPKFPFEMHQEEETASSSVHWES